MALTNSQRHSIIAKWEEITNKPGIKTPSYDEFLSKIRIELKLNISAPTLSRIIRNKDLLKILPANNRKITTKRLYAEFETDLLENFKSLRSLGVIFTEKVMTNLAKTLSKK